MTRDDLPVFKEVVLSYEAWRRATGKPPSVFWQTRIRAELEKAGLVKPKVASPTTQGVHQK